MYCQNKCSCILQNKAPLNLKYINTSVYLVEIMQIVSLLWGGREKSYMVKFLM